MIELDQDVALIQGDCVEVMAGMEDESVDAVVTDPPYGLEFMGRKWDRLDGIGQTSPPTFGPPGIGERRTGWASRSGQSNRRCEACGHWEYSGTPCRCDRPVWPNVSAHQGRLQQEWHHAWAREALRILRPGGHLLAFGGTRTFHRLTCAIEDAGFEVRDCLSWLYGSGFPKSLDVSKAIDKRPGVSRHAEFARHLTERREVAGLMAADVSERVVGTRTGACWNWEHHQFPEARWWPALRELLDLDESWGEIIAEAERERTGQRDGNLLAIAPGQDNDRSPTTLDITAPATPGAARWQGWGTALKPAFEPIVVARKPLAGTVAANVLAHGTGAINVDGCRVGTTVETWPASRQETRGNHYHGLGGTQYESRTVETGDAPAGRWPANVVLSHTPDCREVGVRKVRNPSGSIRGDEPSPVVKNALGERERVAWEAHGTDGTETVPAFECSPDCPVRMLDEQAGDILGAVSNGKRAGTGYGEGYGVQAQVPSYADTGGPSRFFYTAKASSAERDGATHPTVKPLELMRWLVRLVTPPGGLVLDPFAGSGTTLIAAKLEGLRAVGIEREESYCEMAAERYRRRYDPAAASWTGEREEDDQLTIFGGGDG